MWLFATRHHNSSLQSRNLGSESSQDNTWNDFRVTFSLDDCPHDRSKTLMPHDIIPVEMGAGPLGTEALSPTTLGAPDTKVFKVRLT